MPHRRFFSSRKITSSKAIATFKELDTAQMEGVSLLQYDSSTNFLATASVSGVIKIWNVNQPEKCLHSIKEHRCIQKICFSPDGHYLAVNRGSLVNLWSLHTGKHIKTLHSGPGTLFGIGFQFSSFNQLIISSPAKDKLSEENRIEIWDLKRGRVLKKMNTQKHRAGDLALLPSSYLVTIPDLNDKVGESQIWNIIKGKSIHVLRKEMVTPKYTSICLSHDNALMITYAAGMLDIWDAKTFEHRKAIDIGALGISGMRKIMTASPNLLIGIGLCNRVVVWNLANFECIHITKQTVFHLKLHDACILPPLRLLHSDIKNIVHCLDLSFSRENGATQTIQGP